MSLMKLKSILIYLEKHKMTYCGNNAQHQDLLSGNKTLGTRYSCLRKGIGIGLNQPLDPTYGGLYTPIDDRRIYCGNDTVLPADYDLMGKLPWCLSKGVGIGKKMRHDDGGDSPSLSPNTTQGIRGNIYIVIFTSISIVLFIILYLFKPKMRKKRNKNKINWKKFIIVYCISLVVLGSILFLIYKNTH